MRDRDEDRFGEEAKLSEISGEAGVVLQVQPGQVG
jgi:hypothetical protein